MVLEDKERIDQMNRNQQAQKFEGEQAKDGALVETKLSLHPKVKLSPEDQYIYRFYHNEAKALKPNTIALMAFEVEEKTNAYHIKAFVRHSVNRTLELGEATIMLLDEEHRYIGEQAFNLKLLGKLPPKSSRPWVFQFNKKNVTKKVTDPSVLSIGFKPKDRHRLDLDAHWKELLNDQQIESLETFVSNNDNLKPGEFNFVGIVAEEVEPKTIAVNALLRNATGKDMEIKHIPLALYDKNKTMIAKAGFNLKDCLLYTSPSPRD